MNSQSREFASFARARVLRQHCFRIISRRFYENLIKPPLPSPPRSVEERDTRRMQPRGDNCRGEGVKKRGRGGQKAYKRARRSEIRATSAHFSPLFSLSSHHSFYFQTERYANRRFLIRSGGKGLLQPLKQKDQRFYNRPLSSASLYFRAAAFLSLIKNVLTKAASFRKVLKNSSDKSFPFFTR